MKHSAVNMNHRFRFAAPIAAGLCLVAVAALYYQPKWFPESAQVKRIRIYKKSATEFRTVDSAEKIREFVDLFTQGAVYTYKSKRESREYETAYRLVLELQDGSETEIHLIDQTLGKWKSFFTLPDELWDLVDSDPPIQHAFLSIPRVA